VSRPGAPADGLRRARALVERAGAGAVPWGVVDQALSSGTNVVVAFLVVRMVPAVEFGAFSLMVVVYVLAAGVSRSLAGEPLMIRFSGRPDDAAAAAGALGFAAAAGLTVGTGCALAAAATSDPLRSCLLVLAAAAPLLVVQDGARMVFFARAEPRRAAANDLAWAVLQVVLVGAVLRAGASTGAPFVAAWAGAGAGAGAVALVQLRRLPAPARARDWIRAHGRLGAPLLGTYLLTTAVSYVLFALMPLVSDLEQLGRVRAAYLPFGVFGVVLQSAWLVLLPAASRTGDDARLRRLTAGWSAVLAGAALVWAIVVMRAPDALGRRVLGDQWEATWSSRAWFAGALVAYAAGVGPAVGLRALEAAGPLVRIRLVVTPVVIAAGLALAARIGAPGAAAAILAGDVLSTGLAWTVFHRIVADRRAAATGPPPVVRRAPAPAAGGPANP
jgi:hypothetical protein